MLTSIDKSEYNNHNIEQESSNIFLDENQRSIIINESQPLLRSSVLYLGTAIPSLDQRGIDSIQEPLSKRYPIDGTEVVQGIEVWLSIDRNGLQIQFASDPSVVLYYPIRSLVYCASIRFATRTQTDEKFPNGWRFVPLDTPEAILTENIQNPPIFAVSFHRTRYSPIDECHCFVVKTRQIALALVQACCTAYQTTDSEQDCSKVPLYFKIHDDGLQMKEIDNEIFIVPALDEKQTSDYQINNNTDGFFYKTDQVPIDYWQLWEHQKHGIQKSPEPQLAVDPYAPEPDVIRVERIKDIHSGRDVFIRWLHDPTEVSEQISTIQTPNYDFNTDYQSERELPNEIQRLVLDEKLPTSHEHKKSKKKDRHKKTHSVKTHKKRRHKYTEVVDLSAPPLIQQEFLIPSVSMTFHTIQLPSQSNSTPFWFYAM